MTHTLSTPIPTGFGAVLSSGVEDGVEWFTCSAPMFGAVNGYAHLPEGHPWRGLDLQCDDYDKGPDVHGGVTYGPNNSGWIGFDTLHSGDVWPDAPNHGPTSWDIPWTPERVEDEARELARQIAAAVSA